MRFDDMPTLEDMAYGSARDSFELHRDKIMDKAVDAHDKGMQADYEGRIFDGHEHEAEAQRLLREARGLRYTGLCWEQDNGLMDCY